MGLNWQWRIDVGRIKLGEIWEGNNGDNGFGGGGDSS